MSRKINRAQHLKSDLPKGLLLLDKIVISRSLNSVGGNTRIVRGNPAAALLKWKQQPGKKILVDSVSLLPELIATGLIDEFNLVVHPIMVGKGRPLPDAGSLQEKLDLKLVGTFIFKSGSVALHYLKQ